MVPQSVQKFRQEYRQTVLPRYYSGVLHVLFAGSLLIGAIVYHAFQLHALSWKECLAFPAVFLLSNWVEYMIHRYPLHQKLPGFRMLYKIHSTQHHQYFTDQAIAFQNTRDFKMILFPEWAPVLIVASSSAIAYFLANNVGHIFAIMATAALLLYEILHFYYHLSEQNPLTRVPFLSALRRHHTEHHNLRLMTKYNFNVTFPIFDWVYGTRYCVNLEKSAT